MPLAFLITKSSHVLYVAVMDLPGILMENISSLASGMVSAGAMVRLISFASGAALHPPASDL
jgi:hypothetical protein